MITYVLKPRFCPNCGKPLKDASVKSSKYGNKILRLGYYKVDVNGIKHVVTCQAVHGGQPPKACFVKEIEIEFDCYCDACKWSGEISPDQRQTE